MASPYALPSSAFPHAHQTRMHARNQSQTSMHSWKSSLSNQSLQPHSEDDDHERSHHHHPARRDSHRSSQSSNTSAMMTRMKQQPPSLDTMDGWSADNSDRIGRLDTPDPNLTPMPSSPSKYRREPDFHNHRHQSHLGHGRSHEHSHSHSHSHNHSHGHDHGHNHAHDHGHGHGNSADRSAFTRHLLKFSINLPIIHAILTEKDSRRIFYFMLLNLGFMVVQAFYGFATDSLGLLSDSIHMFFDCVALLVGLLAAVMSKWPPSVRFPYGFGKIETLSGFANGILLMLLSVEIAFEAFERLWEGVHTKRLGELFVVSTLGLAVNLVGMMAFGHHHHHGHSHEHSHHHGHSHGDHHHSHDKPVHCHDSHGHGHSHDNENMRGIYLHILADTMGSASVIVSTVLTHFWDWAGWDPLASCVIAALIFLSAQPLVFSSAKRLLISVPENTEYSLRDTLGGILDQRGVVSYSTPKFWMDDHNGGEDGDKLVGVVHVMAARSFPLGEVGDRVQDYLMRHGIKAVIQVEREGDHGCWCNRTRSLAPSPQILQQF